MDGELHIVRYVGHGGCWGIFVCPWINERLQLQPRISKAEYK